MVETSDIVANAPAAGAAIAVVAAPPTVATNLQDQPGSSFRKGIVSPTLLRAAMTNPSMNDAPTIAQPRGPFSLCTARGAFAGSPAGAAERNGFLPSPEGLPGGTGAATMRLVRRLRDGLFRFDRAGRAATKGENEP